jgi:glycosyltransferase involved in cell wall biosynthesis
MNVNSQQKVIGIILAYKCGAFLEEVYRHLPHDILDEVIITNDESGDNTEEVARKLGIPCYSHPKLGYGGNMKYGIAKALEHGAEYMVEIHGDGQYDTSFIKPGVLKAKEGYDLVLGSRFTPLLQPIRDDMPLIRYVANIFLTTIDRIVLGIRASELHTGARVYRRKAITSVDLTHTSNDYLFSFEIIAQIAYKRMRVGQVPVRCYYKKEHTSISIRRSITYAIATFGVLFYYVVARLGIPTRLFHPN